MPQENIPVSNANQFPAHIQNHGRFGRTLQVLARAEGRDATASNHAKVVQSLIEKVHLAGTQSELNYSPYQEALHNHNHDKVWYEDIFQKYLAATNEIDNLRQRLYNKEAQIVRQELALRDSHRTIRYLQQSWDQANHKYELCEWRCQRLWEKVKESDPTSSFPTLLDDIIEGPEYSAVYEPFSDSDSEDPYQGPTIHSSARTRLSQDDDYVPPRKVFKEVEQ